MLYQQIQFPYLQETAHLSGQEVKTLFSSSKGHYFKPTSFTQWNYVKVLETFTFGDPDVIQKHAANRRDSKTRSKTDVMWM